MKRDLHSVAGVLLALAILGASTGCGKTGTEIPDGPSPTASAPESVIPLPPTSLASDAVPPPSPSPFPSPDSPASAAPSGPILAPDNPFANPSRTAAPPDPTGPHGAPPPMVLPSVQLPSPAGPVDPEPAPVSPSPAGP